MEKQKSAHIKICEDITLKGVDITLVSDNIEGNSLQVTCGFPFDQEMAETLVRTIEQGLKRNGISASHTPLTAQGDVDFNLEHHTTISGRPVSRCEGHRMLDIALSTLHQASSQGFAATPLGDYLEQDNDNRSNRPELKTLQQHYWGVVSKIWPRNAAHFFGASNADIPETLRSEHGFLALRQQLLDDVSRIAASYNQTPDFNLRETLTRCIQAHLCEWDFTEDKLEAVVTFIANRTHDTVRSSRNKHGGAHHER